jgi:hypothetical protein
MSQDNSIKQDQHAPQSQLNRMAMAYGISRLLRVAVELNLADHVAGGHNTAEDLSRITGTHAASLYRVMRALANQGIFNEDTAQCFSLTPLGEALKTDAPGSVRSSVLMLTGDLLSKAMDQLLYSVQTGKTGFERAFGMPLFEWLETHPEDSSLFSETMACHHGTEHAAVAASYDFSPFPIIVDVGGATGHLLAQILSRSPEPRGILYDLPHVVSRATALLESFGLTDRVRIEPGSFFERVPPAGDAYLLSHVLHDWAEEQCLIILENCRRAMKPGSRLLIIEMVLPGGSAPHAAKRLDISMLVLTGGQQRDEREYRELLSKAGFRLARVVSTESPTSIVEAFPV